jgi:hypothetical protein
LAIEVTSGVDSNQEDLHALVSFAAWFVATQQVPLGFQSSSKSTTASLQRRIIGISTAGVGKQMGGARCERQEWINEADN